MLFIPLDLFKLVACVASVEGNCAVIVEYMSLYGVETDLSITSAPMSASAGDSFIELIRHIGC